MFNPDPQKYLGLRDSFNELGRERFPKTWTDSELDARDDLPKLDDLRRHIDEEATQRRNTERQAAKEKKAHAAKAAKAGSSVAGSPGGAEPPAAVGSVRQELEKAIAAASS